MIMAIIPNPKTHDDVAKNQHLIPRCYMKAWKHNNGKDSKVWVFDKSTHNCLKNPEKSDWTLKSLSTKDITVKNGFHDIKAGAPYMPNEALHEIYDDILQFDISYNGEKLDSADILDKNICHIDDWIIKDSNGVVFTEEERASLKKYFSESRWTYVETEWAHSYENNWGYFIQSLENKVKQACAQCNISTSTNVTQDELNKLMKYCIIYNWRSIAGSELLNESYDAIPFIDHLKAITIPEAERTYDEDITAYDQIKHASIIKAFVDYLQSDTGKMKAIERAYEQRLSACFLLADDNTPFITSDVPSFMRERSDGLKELLFIATPTLAIRYGNGNTGNFLINRLSPDDVLEYNKSIAKYGNKLIIRDKNYDIKSLFT